TPAGASSYLDLGSGNALVASNGTGKLDCTKGSGPASECVDAGVCVGGPTPGATCFTATGCGTGGTCSGADPHKACPSDADCSGTGATGCSYGPNAGGACSTNSTTGNAATSNTSQDCPPEFGGGLFNGALAVELNPLTTGSSSVTNISGTGSGNFCAGQLNNGAFGQATTQCITETGMAAGNLTDGAPHAAREGVVFCIPATGNGTVNAVVDLPGPGAT